MLTSKYIEKEQAVGFRYSRTFWFLPLILTFLFITANHTSINFVQSTRRAIGFALIMSVGVACLFLPDGLINRPTKYLWKAITGISFFYLGILIYLLYLDKQSALNVITTYFDPNLKLLAYQEVSYAADCRIVASEAQDPYKNISNAFFDLFAVAHFLGWFFKTLICRDFKLIMFASISFEMIEFALRNVLNNFKECWWDHVIVDIFGCNLLGIFVGFYVIDKFGMERFKWSLREAPMKHSTWQNIKLFWTQWNVSRLETKAFASCKKYIQMTYFILLFQANDLALFFLKYIYGIPPSNYMCICRVWIVGLLCVNAAKQYYDYMIHRERYIRINSFLVNFIVYTEFFIVFKQGKNDFNHAFIDNTGIILLALLAFIFIILFVKILISDLICYFNNQNLITEQKEINSQTNKSIKMMVKTE